MRRLALALLISLVSPIIVLAQFGKDATIRYRVRAPLQSWSCDVRLPESFLISEERDRSSAWLYAVYSGPPSTSSVFSISLSIGIDFQLTDAALARERYLKKSKLKDVQLFERNGVPMILGKFPRTTSNLNPQWSNPSYYDLVGFWRRDESSIFLAVSFPDKPNPEALEDFYQIMDTLRFVDTSKPKDSFDYYQLGRVEYQAKNYIKAAEYFAPALDLERKERFLNIPELRQLIVQAADSFGTQKRTEDYKSAFEFGVSVDPAYHVYHWGLAQYYAAKNDKEKTLEFLRTMYEQMPKQDRKPKDILFTLGSVRTVPEENELFTKFLKDAEFRRALKRMRDQ